MAPAVTLMTATAIPKIANQRPRSPLVLLECENILDLTGHPAFEHRAGGKDGVPAARR